MLVLKKCLCILLCAVCLTLSVAAADCRAQAWVVYHPGSGEILAGGNYDTPLPMASTTKIMTALLVLERCDLREKVVIGEECCEIEGSSLYLQPGDEYSVEELLLGLLLASGNDAAAALARHACASEEAFVAAMNERARAMGLEHTHFMNPHGLPAEGHFASARDLAVLMGVAMENPDFRRIAGTKSAVIHGLTVKNHNKLLGLCEGVNGGKTGYTRAAGRCLVSSCCREGLEVVCVTLNDRSDWDDHAALYEETYERCESYAIPAGTALASVRQVGGSGGNALALAGESVSLCIQKGSEVTLTLRVPRFVFAPATPGGRAGEAELRWEGKRRTLPLVWAAP